MMTSKDVRLGDYIDEKCILCGIDASSRDDAIGQLVSVLHRQLGGFDRDAAVEAVLERERQAPTVLSEGLALPHARLGGLARPVLAMGISREGVDFEAVGEEDVQVVVLILTPRDDPGAYLRLVASLAKVLGAPQMLKRLVVAESSRQVRAILVEGGEPVEVKLCAASVMNPSPVRLDEGDTLGRAIDALCGGRAMDIPVVDAEGDLRGAVSIEDLLGLSLPQHLLWMENLGPIENFEPFAELLRRDSETKVADFMRDKFVAVTPDTPAIQLARIFLTQPVRQIHVVEGRRFLGTVNLDSFVSQIFWA